MNEIKHISPKTEEKNETKDNAQAATMVKASLSKVEKDQIFEQEFLPHLEALYNFAYHLSYDEENANDLVQETFLKSYRFINSYKVGTNAKAWLFQILKNAFINQYRKKNKRPIQVDFEDVVNYHDADAENVKHLNLGHEIFQGMMGDEVTIALNSLPIDSKTIVLLCDIEGFTYEEIATIINIPIGTVRSRIHRARNMLKEKLESYAQNLGFDTDARTKKKQ
ncbi:MAG: sigma-70 family RNA polymerase sigma factor [Chitinophagales bacterium]